MTHRNCTFILLTILSAPVCAQTVSASSDSLSKTADSTKVITLGEVTPVIQADSISRASATTPEQPAYATDDEGIPLDLPMQQHSDHTKKTKKPGAEATTQARLLRMANELYAKRAYAEAIPYYEKSRDGDS